LSIQVVSPPGWVSDPIVARRADAHTGPHLPKRPPDVTPEAGGYPAAIGPVHDRFGKESRTSELHIETRSDKRPPLSRPARVLLVVTAGFFALLLIAQPLLDACVNWLWFGEVGFRRVWVTVWLTRLAIFVAVALVVGGAVLVAMTLAYRSPPPPASSDPANRCHTCGTPSRPLWTPTTAP
jgi:hypothetical protein